MMPILFLLQSFITQDPADRDILVRGLKSFDVPVLNYVADRSHKNSSFTVSEEVYII